MCASTFRVDSGIVNYYHPGDMLCGHVDDAEFDMVFPIVSVSLGSSCIFLIGTDSKECPPMGVLLQCGDVLVMGGKSRMSYHGVPVIFPSSAPDWVSNPEAVASYAGISLPESHDLCTFWSGMRINLNCRQVYSEASK
jgi:alkylated DNA repair protein alkB family protein 1